MTSSDPRLFRIDLDFAQQIDLPATLAPLGRSGDDLLDRWDGRVLVRTADIGGTLIPYAGRLRGTRSLSLASRAGDPVANGDCLRRAVRSTFVTDQPAVDELAARDRRVAWLADRHPGVVPVLFRDPFAALVRSISAQQVNLRWAATVRRRLAERYGRRLEIDGWAVCRIEADALAGATLDDLRGLQLTSAKARSLVACAHAAQTGELDMDQLERATDAELIEHLTQLPGIGRWSAEWFLARTLGRPRVVAGDLGVRKAVGRLYARPVLPTELEVRRLTEHWGRAAAIVQTLALHELALSASPVRPPAG